MAEATGSAPRLESEPVALGAGTQALVTTRPLSTAVSQLPAAAFENLLVVAIGREPVAVENAVVGRGHDPAKVGVVPVSKLPMSAEAGLWTAPRVGPSDLTGISIGIARGMEYVRPSEGWVLVDGLDVLLMHAEEARVFQLLTVLASKLRARNVRGLYAVSRDTVSDETRAKFRALLDVECDLA